MVKRITIFFTLIVLGGFFFWQYANKQVEAYLSQPLKLTQAELFTVSRGESVSSILSRIHKQKLISPKNWIWELILRHEMVQGFRAGTYQIAAGSTMSDFCLLLKSGKEHQFSVTFVEGGRFSDWRVQLAELPHLKKALAQMTDKEVMAAVGADTDEPEGWFFPDTYYYTAQSEDLSILKRAYKRMKQQLAQHWQQKEIGGQLTSPYEALILASIIEKESGYEPEMPLISSVFHNRLKNRMRLQTDPTVIYGLGDTFDGNLTRAHLKQKTAFNTYVIRGLPPTPIAMPGASALKAATAPDKSRYFYFVSRGDGTHIFANTLSEHNRNVRRYQLKRQE